MQRRSRPPRPLITVSGSTGSGKSTVGAHLAALHSVPAVELGVILRLVCLDGKSRRPGSRIWGWARSGRLDFGAESGHGLAAALPRLDGRSAELDMWVSVERERLAAIARVPEVQEVLAELAGALGRRSGAVIIGRVAEPLPGARALHLDAAPAIRVARKRRQLASIELPDSGHDWFDPRMPRANTAADQLDTTNLGPITMCRTAAGILASGRLSERQSVA